MSHRSAVLSYASRITHHQQVGELMDVDLHRAIYYGRPLSAEHIQFFLYQLLCGIKYIHSVGIVHRCVRACVRARARAKGR